MNNGRKQIMARGWKFSIHSFIHSSIHLFIQSLCGALIGVSDYVSPFFPILPFSTDVFFILLVPLGQSVEVFFYPLLFSVFFLYMSGDYQAHFLFLPCLLCLYTSRHGFECLLVFALTSFLCSAAFDNYFLCSYSCTWWPSMFLLRRFLISI